MSVFAARASGASPDDERLSASQLAQASRDGPWPMSSFAPPADARPATNVFKGRLRLGPTYAHQGFRVLLDRYGDATANDRAAERLPAFEFILEPGRVWDEPGGGGYSRAALPFTLEERNENCMHHGVLTFLFRDDGSVSSVAYEIGSETCSYFQFDAWGYANARYLPGRIPNRSQVLARYRAEIAQRIPVRPIDALHDRYPTVDPTRFAFPSEVEPARMTVYGVVAGGIHYVSACETRFGRYPFCEVLDLPSYSVAKSVAAGLAVMRAALADPRIVTARIPDYVSACARAGTWNEVTLGDALDMTTGHFNSSVSMADEYASDVVPFFIAETHQAKIEFACAHYPRKEPSAKVWVYHTTDTYLLGAALSAIHRARYGANADMFHDLLVAPIWTPLHLSPPVAITRRTYDAEAQPFMGYGLTLHRDDVAKLATFLNVERGAIGGHAVISREMLDDALRREPSHPAFAAPTAEYAYKNGFWAWNAQSALGCRKETWVALMLGYGGIVIALYPNDVSSYYFSDGGAFKWLAGAVEANKMQSFCMH